VPCRPDPDTGAETLPSAHPPLTPHDADVLTDAAPDAATGSTAPAGPRRTVAVPAVLLVAGTLAMAGLAAPSPSGDDTVRVTAAAQTSTVVDLGAATAGKRLDLLDGPLPVVAPTVKKATPPRATRTRTRPVAKKKVESARYCRPNGGGISSNYGQRWGRMHKGVDFNGSYGSPIRAAAAGRVVSAGYDGGYRNLVTVRHADGTVTAYAHMSKILVRGGQVDACDTLGYVGSTGHSTGPHLHFEVRVGGGTTSPLPWLRKHGVRV
jgi:murein DD-endopeptidase MepM/ murein hydrolase activator NlpD